LAVEYLVGERLLTVGTKHPAPLSASGHGIWRKAVGAPRYDPFHPRCGLMTARAPTGQTRGRMKRNLLRREEPLPGRLPPSRTRLPQPPWLIRS
jgi:hypothetical protein